VNDSKASEVQIEWEHQQLARSEAIIFWFPCETLCPITLYELGAWTNKVPHKPLFVGTHASYTRRIDVIIQTRLERGNTIHVADSIASIVEQVETWWYERIQSPRWSTSSSSITPLSPSLSSLTSSLPIDIMKRQMQLDDIMRRVSVDMNRLNEDKKGIDDDCRRLNEDRRAVKRDRRVLDDERNDLNDERAIDAAKRDDDRRRRDDEV
jgi:hypothetical protein